MHICVYFTGVNMCVYLCVFFFVSIVSMYIYLCFMYDCFFGTCTLGYEVATVRRID